MENTSYSPVACKELFAVIMGKSLYAWGNSDDADLIY